MKTRIAAVIVFAPMSFLTGCGGAESSEIEGTGTLEVIEVDVAAMTPARVLRVWREEGDSVRVGDTLVSLTQSTVHADVEARRTRVAAAEAQLRDLLAGATAMEIARAENELRAAETEATHTRQEFDRLTALKQSGGVSEQQLDAARNASALASARRDAARSALGVIRAGSRPDRVAAARAEVGTARAALAAAVQTAADLVLLAPANGVVLLRNVEPGEVIAAGVSAMSVGELARPYVRIYVNQRAVPGVRLGAAAVGVLDGLPDRRFTGRVVAINTKAEFTPRVALTEEERADLLFGVKVEFLEDVAFLKPGLPITVRISSAAR